MRLHVQPGARREQVVGIHDSRLRMTVTAPADQGKANAAVIRLLADVLGLPASCLSVHRGRTSRRKDVLVRQCSQASLQEALARLLADEEPSQHGP